MPQSNEKPAKKRKINSRIPTQCSALSRGDNAKKITFRLTAVEEQSLRDLHSKNAAGESWNTFLAEGLLFGAVERFNLNRSMIVSSGPDYGQEFQQLQEQNQALIQSQAKLLEELDRLWTLYRGMAQIDLATVKRVNSLEGLTSQIVSQVQQVLTIQGAAEEERAERDRGILTTLRALLREMEGRRSLEDFSS